MSLAPETPCRMRPISFEDRETPPPLPYQMQARDVLWRSECWGVKPFVELGFGSDSRGSQVFRELFVSGFPAVLQEGVLVSEARHGPRSCANISCLHVKTVRILSSGWVVLLWPYRHHSNQDPLKTRARVESCHNSI